MVALRAAQVVLKILATTKLPREARLDRLKVRDTFRVLVDAGVQFTIATDVPEVMRRLCP